MGLFTWTEKPGQVLAQGGVIAPDERLPWPQTAAKIGRASCRARVL